MANLIQENLYRVSLDSERNFVYVSAKDPPDLIRFLVDSFVGTREIFGVKEVGRDGMLSTIPVITNPLFQELCAAKLAAFEQGRGEVSKLPLSSQIQAAAARNVPYSPSETHTTHER